MKKKRGGIYTAKKIDWNRIRVEYVTGKDSYRAIAEKHGISTQAVARQGKDEKWHAQRLAFHREAASRAIDKCADNEAKRLSKLREAADCMSDVVLKLFSDAQQFHRHIVINGDTMDEKMFDKVDTKAIKDLTGALKDMTFVQRNLNNLPTQAEREAQRIAGERLRLDREKARLDENADRSIKVELVKSEEYAE